MKTVLALDPSKTATGWVLIRGGKIIDYGCYKFNSRIEKSKAKGSVIIKKFWEFNLGYYQFLNQLIRENWVTEICAEFPHGTQSYSAAVALTTVKDIISMFELHSPNVPVYFYTEGECKKCYFGRAKGVEKTDTVQAMAARFDGFKPTGVAYVDQAVADALLVYYKHLEEQLSEVSVQAS